jgi:hypothetical protein
MNSQPRSNRLRVRLDFACGGILPKISSATACPTVSGESSSRIIKFYVAENEVTTLTVKLIEVLP